MIEWANSAIMKWNENLEKIGCCIHLALAVTWWMTLKGLLREVAWQMDNTEFHCYTRFYRYPWFSAIWSSGFNQWYTYPLGYVSCCQGVRRKKYCNIIFWWVPTQIKFQFGGTTQMVGNHWSGALPCHQHITSHLYFGVISRLCVVQILWF